MNPRAFILAATAGLACGLLIRLGMPDAGGSSSNAFSHQIPVVGKGALSPAGLAPLGNWESRISHYLQTDLPASFLTTTPAGSKALETDRLLDMLRQPVNAASIRDGVAFLNAMDLADYADVMGSIFERWAMQCPDEALAAVADLHRAEAKIGLIWKAFQLSAGKPGSMMEAMAQPAGFFRTTACTAVLDNLPPDQLQDVLKQTMMGQSPGYSPIADASIQALILKKIAFTDPELPLKLAKETTDPAWRTSLLRITMEKLSQDDPAEFNLKFKSLARDPNNAEGLVESLSSILHRNTAQGIMLMTELPETNRREALQDFVATSMGFFSYPRHRDRENRSGFELVRKDVEQRGGPDGFRAILADSALNHGAQGLVHTAKWLATNSDSTGLDDLTLRATQSEPFTTARWLATLPSSPERDRAVSIFAETHAATDPESATTWAESITDPGKREATLTTVRKIALK